MIIIIIFISDLMSATLVVGARAVSCSSTPPAAFQSISQETCSSAIETEAHSAQPKACTLPIIHLAPYTQETYCYYNFHSSHTIA